MAKKARGAAPRPPRTKANVPGAAGNTRERKGDNSEKMSVAEEQALFGQIRSHWIAAQSKLALAKKAIEDVVAEANEAGYTKKMMMIADDLANTRGEAKIKGEVSDRLHVARLIGHPMGAQFDLFERGVAEKEAAGSVDRAYDAGRLQSINNEPAKPAAAPGSPEYESHMRGFHDHQGELGKGFKPTREEPAVGEIEDAEAESVH